MEALATVEAPALSHFKNELRMGRPWHEALLESMGMWTTPEEEREGRIYRYVIAEEAFDWLLLAERLLDGVNGLAPQEAVEELLFRGRLPMGTSEKEMRRILGYNKYRGALNYWYGVVVEEALQQAVEEEVRKEMRGSGRVVGDDLGEEPFQRLYADSRDSLMRRFRKEKGHASRVSFSLTQMKEFTYWLFKHRMQYWDPARVASDTRKALIKLKELRGETAPF